MYEEFGFLPKRSPRSLRDELLFAALHIGGTAKEISEQIRVHRVFEAAVWADQTDMLESILGEIEKRFGHSLWLIEATIATKQYVSGLESQKRFAERIGSISRRRQAEYYSYYLSVRNEPNATPARFAEEFESIIRKTKYSASVKIYLLFKIAGLMPVNLARLADLLMVEHGSADIDLYETFLVVCQEIVSKAPSADLVSLVGSLVGDLAKRVDDFRLRQILLVTGENKSVEGEEQAKILGSDLMLAGRLGEALRVNRDSLRKGKLNSNDLISIATVRAASKLELSLSGGKLMLGHQTRNLAVLLRKGSEYERANADLQKFAVNWSFLPSVRAISAFVLWDSRSLNDRALSWSLKRLLNSASNDPRSLLGIFDLVKVGNDQVKQLIDGRSGLTIEYLGYLLGDRTGISKNLDPYLSIALAHIDRINDPASREWPSIWSEIKESKLPDFVENRCALHLVNRLLETDELGMVADVIVDLVLLKGLSSQVLPLRELAAGDTWRRLRQYSANIAIPIVIDLIWRVTGDDRDSTAKRFAVQKFLAAHSLAVPSQIAQAAGDVGPERIVYFLQSVCTATVLDMLPTLSSSQIVEDERVNICRALSELDPKNSDLYQDEIFVSEHQRVVKSGLRVVDSSRIHVDQDALVFWASRELGETFRRYCDLVKAGVGVADNYDTLMRGFFKADEFNKAYFEIPKSEADDILIRMVSQISDRFINDSSYGLDSYLSKRVRHESLTSYLRNPLERKSLITQIDSRTGRYEKNTRWTEVSEECPIEVSLELEAYLNEFSESFDRILVALRAEDFHIRSKEHPGGLFEFTLTAPMLHLLRSVVQQRLEVEDFARTCLALFWVTLNPSLERARERLRVDTKSKIATLFEQLRAKIYPLMAECPAVAELSAAIGDASATIQAEIESVSEWFVRQEVGQGMHRYTLEQAVEIASESALRGMRNFEPEIHIASTGDVLIAASELVVIADVIRVALGNVKA
ncbi:hypothetical protein ACQR2B_32795 [Bradyrhizobium oligotrophicum]|uniref:hypothetical protein n=1 Tax=Bradyrhizobium TaxID=374 RepID=UPI003EC08FD3